MESMASSRSLPAGLVTRVRILLSAAGRMNQQICPQVGIDQRHRGKRRRGFVEQEVSELHDELLEVERVLCFRSRFGRIAMDLIQRQCRRLILAAVLCLLGTDLITASDQQTLTKE
jgi:hypothetical protein